ncbi:PIN-like domain-containing protein [uncultured Enterococcus sp.]|uniref:PIN-like domain-containing protein n=1 Tax=uncultured Enterococcus sp. TaxID=167972 RepID=UPI002585A5DC|nr:PIN-like domain-containing protein [uncultured Enterococcus sp.]
MDFKTEFPDFYRQNLENRKPEMNSSNTSIVFDTNSLLNVFRFSPNTSDSFIKTIEKQKEWLYIPYLVALEFHFNKKSVMTEYEDKVTDFKNKFEKKWKKISEDFSKDMFEDFSFREGQDVTKQISLELSKDIREVLDQNKDDIKNKSYKKVEKISEEQASLYSRLIASIEEKTGNRYKQDWINDVQTEGKERYPKKYPPGYDDSNKSGKFRKYNSIEYDTQYGDLIIWKDILEYSKDKDYIIWVTSDGQSPKKSDLQYKLKNNKIIGPRVELIEELRLQSNANLFIINESKFIELFSDFDTLDREKVITSIDMFYQNNDKLLNSKEKRARIMHSIDDLKKYLLDSDVLEDEAESLIENYLEDISFDEGGIPLYGNTEITSLSIKNLVISSYEMNFEEIKGQATADITVSYNFYPENHADDTWYMTDNLHRIVFNFSFDRKTSDLVIFNMVDD